MSKKQKSPGPTKPNIFLVMKPYLGLVILLLIVALLSNSLNLLIPKIIARAIDAYTTKRFALKEVLIQFSLAAIAIFIFTYLQSILQTFVSEKVAKDMRTSLSDKISCQDQSYIIQMNPSKLLTNLTSDTDSVKMFVSQAVVTIVSSLFMIIGTSVFLIMINWKLALVVMGIIPIIAGAFFIILKKVRVLFKRSREIIDRLNKIINESILGAALVRVLNSQQPEYEKFLLVNTDARNLGMSILKLFATLIPIVMFVSNMAMVSILLMGGHFVLKGTMTLGDFAAFINYLGLLIFPILMIGFMSNIIAQASASYNRIVMVLQSPDQPETGTVSIDISGKLKVQNISLNYGEKEVLKDISFSVESGSKTAIIGPTAAGKSQLLYLMTDLIKPTSGSISYDGVGIHELTKEVLHNQIGFVFQDSVIFNLSIRENIAFNDKVTDESLEKAIATAELYDFIDSLPKKLDTLISERGTNLSGGQKQRIMLARALSIHPKILLLDDFTARVDRKTENKILCNLENNYPDLTLITVTQKITSAKTSSQIILLMEGEIIAKGTHKELLDNCPEYVQIYNSQRSTHHYEL